ENKKLIKRFFDEGVHQKRLNVLDELCAKDIVDHAATPEHRNGIESIKWVVGSSLATQPDQHWSTVHMIAEGDYVVVHGIREATWQATTFQGLPTPTGKQVAVELVHIFRIADHKIAEHWTLRDDLGLMQQLGALPAIRTNEARV